MSEIIHNKLVRDKIPEIIRADGHEPVTRMLDDAEMQIEARKKLAEEASEIIESGGDLNEYADLFAVMQAALAAEGYSWNQLEDAVRQKAVERGAFVDRIYLEKVIKNEYSD